MNRERLEQVIRVLKSVPPQHFFMGFWRGAAPPYRPGLCGTTCCAIGHCAQDPWFIAQGFTLNKDGMPAPSYAGARAFDAVRLFFDISNSDARHLFGCQNYDDTIPNTIARIQEFLSKDKKYLCCPECGTRGTPDRFAQVDSMAGPCRNPMAESWQKRTEKAEARVLELEAVVKKFEDATKLLRDIRQTRTDLANGAS